jgi:4-hydroxy-tetrahydrodipicolinate synthase
VAPYYDKPSQGGRYRHYCEIARSVEFPIIVENDPSRNGVDILPETLARLTEIPNIVGVESATGDLSRPAGAAHSMRQDFVQLSGDDNTCVLFRMAGADGSVSVVANAVPKLWAEMQQASASGDWGRAMAIRVRLQPLLSALRLETNPGPIKYALTFLRPWFSPKTRLPLVPVSYDTGNAIVAALQGLDLIEGSLTGFGPTPRDGVDRGAHYRSPDYINENEQGPLPAI